MKRNLLINLHEIFVKKSKKPWACIETEGPNKDGVVPFTFSYNKAFIQRLHDLGMGGIDDEQTVQSFFLQLQIDPASLPNVVNPSELPNLSSEYNDHTIKY